MADLLPDVLAVQKVASFKAPSEFSGPPSRQLQGRRYENLVRTTDSSGVFSAYHEFFKEKFGHETRPTHHHLGHQQKTFHLD